MNEMATVIFSSTREPFRFSLNKIIFVFMILNEIITNFFSFFLTFPGKYLHEYARLQLPEGIYYE